MIKIDSKKLPLHVAVIMDGNGRWAKKRQLNRIQGHRKGTEAVRAVVQTNRELGIPWLTLYSFSEENWDRSKTEISALMTLLKRFLKSELSELMENGIRLQAIGRIDKLPGPVKEVLLDTIEKTKHNKGMVLTLALSYGGRQELTDAVRKIAVKVEKGQLAADDINEEVIASSLYTNGIPDPDLLIRTSGEYRISNFLPWQIAYTEIYITSTLWPDFGKDEYLRAIEAFQQRDRRFGRAS